MDMPPESSSPRRYDKLEGIREQSCPSRWLEGSTHTNTKSNDGGTSTAVSIACRSRHLFPIILLAAAWLIVMTDSLLAASPGHRFALVIGNNHYTHLDPDRQLLKAVNDANAVGDALERDGFKVLRGNDLTRSQIVDKLYELSALIEPGDTALFYFAGHGVALGSGNYLVPSDIPDIEQGQEQRLAGQAVAEADVIATLQDKGTRVTVMILDACRDNPFKKPGLRSVGLSRGFSRVPEANGVFSLYSAGYGQSALDRLFDADPNPNSVFTRVLVPLLTRPGLNLDDLAYEVREKVAQLAATTPDHHPQIPAAYDQIIGGRIYLASTKDGDGAAETAPRVELESPGAPSGTESKPAPSPPPAAQVAVLEPSSNRTVSDIIYLREIGDRLFDQGFDPGDANSPAMASAIRAFEARAGLPQSGQPTTQLLDALRTTRPPSTWGAIAFGPQKKRLGLTWDEPSRREALSQARLHCGTSDCTQVVSFSGQHCGALAMSSHSYFMAWHDDMDHARDDALKRCGAHGTACQVVSAVCADGSGRVALLKAQ